MRAIRVSVYFSRKFSWWKHQSCEAQRESLLGVQRCAPPSAMSIVPQDALYSEGCGLCILSFLCGRVSTMCAR